MRRIVSILLLLIGVVAGILGVGKLTFSSPPETLSASVPNQQDATPVTVITQSARDATHGDTHMTVHADGAFTAVVGRAEDVQAWIGDAAATVVDGVDPKAQTFDVKRVSGAATSPNPAGSDLWVSEEEHNGEWQVSWPTTLPQGEWSMMLATDGTTPAPVNITATWANPAATASAKWGAAMPWLLGAVVALAIGALLLMQKKRTPRRRGGSDEVSPRRAARLAEQTGQLPVVTPAVPAPAEPAAVSAEDPAASAPSVIAARAAEAGEYIPQADDTMIHAAIPGLPAEDAPMPYTDAWVADDDTVVVAGEAELASSDDAEADAEDKDKDMHDDGGEGPAGGAADVEQAAAESSDADETVKRGDEREQRGGLARRSVRAGAVVLASLGLVLPSAPAWAETSTSPTASSSTGDAAVQPYPVILQPQLDRILEQVSAAAKSADADKSDKGLTARFDDSALELRKVYYAGLAKGVKYSVAPVPEIAATPIRAAAVTTTTSWPRLVTVVTQGSGQANPVVLTLEQVDARSNYKAIQAVPMVPGARFDGVALGAPEVTTQPADQSGLIATPAETIDGFGEWLNNPKSAWDAKFEANVFVTAWRAEMDAARKANESEKQRAENQVAVSVDPSATRVLSAPQGGSFVSGSVTVTNTISPEKGGKVSLPAEAAALAGKKETDKIVVNTYRLPVFFYVPKSGSGEKIRLIAESYVLSGVALK